jgi:hypothetical protein
MENLEGSSLKGAEAAFGRVLNRDLFFFFLDLEVKRARRYQNFLCLLLLKIKQCSMNENGWNFHTCCEILSDLISVEMRESDVLGLLDSNKLVVLLPYADGNAGGHAKSRFESTLKYYDFESKGFEVIIDQICFPINGTNTTDLIRKVLGKESG